MGFAIVGVAFWAWLAAVVIAEEVGKTKRRRADLDLLRFAIEKGQPLSPEVMQQVFAKPIAPLFIGGIITVAAGVGLIIFAVILARFAPPGGWFVAGGGAIAICVGTGLIISYRMIRPTKLAVARA